MSTQKSTQMSTQLSIKQAASHFGVAEKTIRRRIEAGKLTAEKVDGRWLVEVVQDTDQTPVRPSVQSNKTPSMASIEQLRSEVKHLRQLIAGKDIQIDQLHKLLAKSTHQNDALVAKLPSPRPKLGERLRPLLVQLRLASPE